jgi:predicted RND superfamily exporter protein
MNSLNSLTKEVLVMKKLSDFIIGKRMIILSVISLITIFFIYRTSKIEVYTKFADLLPQGHEYIKVHNKIRAKFGGANTVNMLLQVREGEIFNTTTLQKIKDITEELYLIPGVDRFKIFSVAVNSMVDMVVTSGGFDFQPMMFPDIPQTQEEMERLKGSFMPVLSTVALSGLTARKP